MAVGVSWVLYCAVPLIRRVFRGVGYAAGMRKKSVRARKCPVCGNAMIKHGRSASDAQRWRCATCALTSTAPRADKARRCQLDEFLDWLLGAAPQRRRRESARNFRKRVDWCWGLAPGIEPDGVVHHTVMADSTYMNGWCLLVAVDGGDGEVLAWQWCDRESAAAYKALFEQIAPPDVLICDGMKGIGKACAEAWPGTRIQRCLIHVQRDTRADLTSRPRLEAGRELKRLADAPARIHDPEHAAPWGEALNAWHERWKGMLAERTYAKDHPDDPRAATSTSGWWWTHLPLRRAYFRLERLFKDGTLFCFLDPTLTAQAPCHATATASREGSTPRSSACSSTTAACPRRTCAAPANGTAT